MVSITELFLELPKFHISPDELVCRWHWDSRIIGRGTPSGIRRGEVKLGGTLAKERAQLAAKIGARSGKALLPAKDVQGCCADAFSDLLSGPALKLPRPLKAIPGEL